MIGSPCLAPPSGTWVQRGWEKHRLRRRYRHTARWLGAGNMFVRRSDFLAVGGFREDLVAAEDVDLCLRLADLPGQIVSDLGVANVHYGEPATLLRFFKKEFWRGSSGLRAFVAQGMPWAEMPTLLYPIYHLIAAAGLLAALAWSIVNAEPLPVLSALLLLALPGLALATKTSWQLREWSAFGPLVALYVTYGLARAAALFR
jgi:GT2 family glycosyltransferase